jgi:hypothetical protein
LPHVSTSLYAPLLQHKIDHLLSPTRPQKKPLTVIYTRSKGRSYLILMRLSSTKWEIQTKIDRQLHSKTVCSRYNGGWTKNSRDITVISKEETDTGLIVIDLMR